MSVITHPIPPVWDEDCTVLILGSFPSVKSREGMFFYHHRQNRFWKTLAAVFDTPVPQSIEEKKAFVIRHRIALWDALEECDISGASDSSIRNPIPTDIPRLLGKTRIRAVFATGATAYRYYRKYNYPRTEIEAIRLPSTSPANCAVSSEQLIEAYRVIRDTLEKK